MKLFKIMISMILMTGLMACNSVSETVNVLRSTTVAQEYSGSIMNVDKIELVDGSTGYRKSIQDKAEIQTFISNIKDLVLIPDKNQEGRTGYIYRIIFYEQEEVKLDFIPNAVNNTYYEPNADLLKIINKEFEERFGREF
ncbi:hypothetical protein [Paenibacillus segetis]|uniref:Lipoprotein n=1 Tax=Paenibacillus segetis TaxID=1325360 RepID=A0ABQ1YF11_9BACL|nr:hypothetical protein [Paenibacillus segetis]GGH22616.1 hypothetical protein GCM10008013_21180 [Paenibacillus segetis]